MDGSYVNAQDIANELVFANVDIEATQEIDIPDPVDFSTSVYGIPASDFSLEAPVCNVAGNVNFGVYGALLQNCGTLNLDARFTAGEELLRAGPRHVIATCCATRVNVLGSGASLQQAVDLPQTSSPADVAVSPGNYAENVTITKPVRLHGVDGTTSAGADPAAPTITGTQAGGNVVTVRSNGVMVDGLHLDGTVNGGVSTASVDGVYAAGVDSLTVEHNTFSGFSGPGIETPGSTNVVEAANVISPTAITSAYNATFTERAAGTFTVTSSGTPAAAISETGALPAGVTLADHGDGTATLAGMPESGTAGTYPITISADNGYVTPASQSFTLTVAPAAHAPVVIGSCTGQALLVKFTPPLTDQTQLSVKMSGNLAKDQASKAPISGQCAAPARPGDAHLPQPSGTLHPKSEAIALFGNATCADTPAANGVDANASNVWPLNGKVSYTMSESYTDLVTGKAHPYKMQADIAILGADSGGSDTIDVGGIVLAGLAPGATVSGSLWLDPVKLTHGSSGYNTGYELDLAGALACADNAANNATVTSALIGGGASTQTSLVGTTNATGLTLSTGE